MSVFAIGFSNLVYVSGTNSYFEKKVVVAHTPVLHLHC